MNDEEAKAMIGRKFVDSKGTTWTVHKGGGWLPEQVVTVKSEPTKSVRGIKSNWSIDHTAEAFSKFTDNVTWEPMPNTPTDDYRDD